MKTKFGIILILIFLLPCQIFPQLQNNGKWAIAIHGGAGNFTKADISVETEKLYIEKLNEALDKGSDVLSSGGTSLDAVEIVIKILEDSPLFNAGKGAVFTHDGKNELDASIMDGSILKAGAVACVTDIKNPITVARLVMTKSEHVLLTGRGASEFAKEQGAEIVDSSYFYTKDRWDQLQKKLAKEKDLKKGTVGCVALDNYGNLAAGTSTGGMTNKKYGRVGDSPVIGAGTYADNKTCAVSCTGHGEYFIRNVVAHDISALVEYKNMELQKAADYVILDKLAKSGGTGGVISLDKKGNIAISFNTSGMFRAYTKAGSPKEIELYKTTVR